MILTEDNLIQFAAHNYINYNCVDNEEFEEDMQRFKYLKKLFTRYRKEGEIQDRLIMNHLVILFNVFNPSALVRILFYKLEKDLDILIPFLDALDYTPEYVDDIKDNTFIVWTKNITPDKHVEELIKKSFKNEIV